VLATRVAGSILVSLLIAPAALAQSISGTLVDSVKNEPVEGAEVILRGKGSAIASATRTDSAGRFLFKTSVAGSYTLSIHKVGFLPVESGALRLKPDSTVVVKLATAASRSTTLPTVEVTAPTARGPNSRKYDQFLLRKSLGMGTFITREQIESRPSTQTYQLFQNIPGLKISQHGTQWSIQSQRCPARLPTAGPPPHLHKDIPGFPILFIDGFRVRGLGTLNTIKPNEVEAIEVYQGAAQLPAEAKGNACAAIFIWLRQGL
jgi:hypothetical protein